MRAYICTAGLQYSSCLMTPAEIIRLVNHDIHICVLCVLMMSVMMMMMMKTKKIDDDPVQPSHSVRLAMQDQPISGPTSSFQQHFLQFTIFEKFNNFNFSTLLTISTFLQF